MRLSVAIFVRFVLSTFLVLGVPLQTSHATELQQNCTGQMQGGAHLSHVGSAFSTEAASDHAIPRFATSDISKMVSDHPLSCLQDCLDGHTSGLSVFGSTSKQESDKKLVSSISVPRLQPPATIINRLSPPRISPPAEDTLLRSMRRRL